MSQRHKELADMLGSPLQQGAIVMCPYVWQLVEFKVSGIDRTRLLLDRNAAIYSFWTSANRWMDSIELDPLVQLPAGRDVTFTFRNESRFKHRCVTLLKCFTETNVFYKHPHETEADAGGQCRTGIQLDERCTLVRVFIATEPDLLLRIPGVKLH